MVIVVLSKHRLCTFVHLLVMIYSILPIGISNAFVSSVQELLFFMLQSIETGRLEVELRYPLCDKRVVSFGDLSPTAEPIAHLVAKGPSVWWQLCGNMDVVSDSTMDRYYPCRDRKFWAVF